MSNNWPKIAIIILNYNGWQDTIECLESVLRNDYQNYQIIVIDNGSSNNSIEYIKAWAEGKLNVWTKSDNSLRHLSHPPIKKPIPYAYYTREEAEKGGNRDLEHLLRVELLNSEKQAIQPLTNLTTQRINYSTNYPLIFIQTHENLGFAGGNNVGIRYALAKDDFRDIILLNNDTVIAKNSISEIMKAREEFGEALYTGRIYYYLEPDKVWYDGGYFNEWFGRTTHINMRKSNIPEKPIHEMNFITFSYVLIPKVILKTVGLLDESYFMYVEDLDYSYRIWKSGHKLYHVSSSKIYHKVGASSGEEEVSEFSAYWIMRNRVRFIVKKLQVVHKISSLIFLLSTRVIRYLLWFSKKRKIIKAQVKGIIEGFRP